MKEKKNKNDKLRLQFDFSNRAVERLDALVKAADCASRAEVVRNALRVYEYLVAKRHEGYEVELVRRHATQEPAKEPAKEPVRKTMVTYG